MCTDTLQYTLICMDPSAWRLWAFSLHHQDSESSLKRVTAAAWALLHEQRHCETILLCFLLAVMHFPRHDALTVAQFPSRVSYNAAV